MIRCIKKILKNKKGFTLIELMAVIVLLSLITTVTTVSIVNLIDKSREKNYDVLIKNIKIGAQEYFEECENINILPSSLPEEACKGFIKNDATEIFENNGLIPIKYAETTIGKLLDYGFLQGSNVKKDDNGNTIKLIENPKTNQIMNSYPITIMKFYDEENSSTWYEVTIETNN